MITSSNLKSMAGYRTTMYQPSAPDLRDEDDLSDEPAALQRGIRLGHLRQRVPDGDRHLELIFVDQAGQIGQHARAGTLLDALSLNAELCRRSEVDDGVDARRLDAKLQREAHVVLADGVDERVDVTGGLPDPVSNPVTVLNWDDPVTLQPAALRLAGDP